MALRSTSYRPMLVGDTVGNTREKEVRTVMRKFVQLCFTKPKIASQIHRTLEVFGPYKIYKTIDTMDAYKAELRLLIPLLRSIRVASKQANNPLAVDRGIEIFLEEAIEEIFVARQKMTSDNTIIARCVTICEYSDGLAPIFESLALLRKNATSAVRTEMFEDARELATTQLRMIQRKSGALPLPDAYVIDEQFIETIVLRIIEQNAHP